MTPQELDDLQALADAMRRRRAVEVSPEQAGVPVSRLWALHVQGLAWGHYKGQRWTIATMGARALANRTTEPTGAPA